MKYSRLRRLSNLFLNLSVKLKQISIFRTANLLPGEQAKFFVYFRPTEAKARVANLLRAFLKRLKRSIINIRAPFVIWSQVYFKPRRMQITFAFLLSTSFGKIPLTKQAYLGFDIVSVRTLEYQFGGQKIYVYNEFLVEFFSNPTVISFSYY